MSKEHQLNLLTQCGIIKLLSDNSTYLIGELKGKGRHHFDKMRKECDKLIIEIEKHMSPENKETLDILNIALSDGIVNLKNEILYNLKIKKS